ARGEVRWATAVGLGHLLGVQFSEHYTPVGDREAFTSTPAKAKAAPDSGDIALAPAEKRQAERFTLKDYDITPHRQGILGTQGLKRNPGRSIHDISLPGAQLEVSEPLELGSLAQFTLHLNALSDTLDALAAVRWCRPDPAVAGSSYRAGLQFLNL